ncbi:hypothetical protein DCAR_0729324 [Daucus carota subsp. sativus]|uniref:RING-type E3 ubiquitin transferase n=1 Tax=Daucus carota subsp. sativus TaxID=79200 RepID=A0A164U4Z9_DAUCS|nr:hypothetical protein DCAR_0729324 [Daucus carota subsp. sativus]
MRQLDSNIISTTYPDTGPVGTLSYIDPEYQRTGLISPKSHVYAFGMVILQLLTAKPPIALTHVVETAIDDGNFTEVLDPEAGDWPMKLRDKRTSSAGTELCRTSSQRQAQI